MLPADIIKMCQIFFPYATAKRQEAMLGNQRFVHYTSAEAAISIIKDKKVWMRNATCMNDYSEVHYGVNCICHAYHSPVGTAFKQKLDEMFPNISNEIAELFDGWTGNIKIDSYLTCISEHIETEDTIGRLSMWRAYGKNNGIAMVFKNQPFLTPSDALKAYTNPVAYFTKQQAELELESITSNILKNIEFIKTINRDTIREIVFRVFLAAALCIKHPGFAEEKEWRVVYTPGILLSTRLISEIRIINGVPQQIFKIPLENVPEENFLGATIPELLDRVIIGPTDYPIAVHKAFVELLTEVGVAEPYDKVVFSDIPIRR